MSNAEIVTFVASIERNVDLVASVVHSVALVATIVRGLAWEVDFGQ